VPQQFVLAKNTLTPIKTKKNEKMENTVEVAGWRRQARARLQ